VTKSRETWQHPEWPSTRVELDDVVGVGVFVEIESTSTSTVAAVLSSLEVDWCIAKHSYADMLQGGVMG